MTGTAPLSPLLVAALLGCASSAPPASTLAPGAARPAPVAAAGVVPVPDEDLLRLEQEILAIVNEHRVLSHLRALAPNAELAAIAREHSRAMAEGRTPFAHGGFDVRARAVEGVVAYRQVAENLAYNTAHRPETAQMAFDGWLRSPGHKRNMEGQWDLTGIGVAQAGRRYYYTQIFVALP